MDDRKYIRSLLNKQSGTFIPLVRNWAEFQRLRQAYLLVRDEVLLRNDPTARFMRTTPDTVGHIRAIVLAMKSTRHSIDAFAPAVDGRPAEIAQSTAFILGLSDLEIQFMAWEVLARIEYASKGIYIMPLVGSWHVWPKPEKYSYDRHLSHVLWMLRRSKMVCYELCIHLTWLDRLAGRPMADLKILTAKFANDIAPNSAGSEDSYMEWEKTMSILPNSSKRRVGKVDSTAIQNGLVEIFRRFLLQDKLEIPWKAMKRPRATDAQYPGAVLVQHNDTAGNDSSMMQPGPPLGFATTLPTTDVPTPEELYDVALGHVRTGQSAQRESEEQLGNADAVNPAFQSDVAHMDQVANGSGIRDVVDNGHTSHAHDDAGSSSFNKAFSASLSAPNDLETSQQLDFSQESLDFSEYLDLNNFALEAHDERDHSAS